MTKRSRDRLGRLALPPPIMRRARADHEEKRVTHGNVKGREEHLAPHNLDQRRRSSILRAER